MGLTTEMLTNGIGESAGIGRSTIGYITGGVAAVGIALKSFTIIPEGSVGVKTRFGKVRRYKKGRERGATNHQRTGCSTHISRRPQLSARQHTSPLIRP